MRASQITCLVTLHGIGFEQPPQPGAENSGYADLLHLHLKTCLGAQLSDDPNRTRRPDHPGENGAIYVQSHWRDAQGRASREEGLNRIGKWCDDLQRVNITDAPLVANGEPISHVALVYSNLEPTGPAVGATLTILGMGLFASSPYANALGLLHMVLTDGLALFKYPTTPEGEPTSIRPRTDWRHPFANLVGYHGQAAPRSSPGVLAAFRNVEDDVACYVCYNEERERVRSFVREALTRLASRPDVANIVFNAHSNGTVIGFDVLRSLPEGVTRKIKTFVTAGSPLRKYVDLFHWGNQIQYLAPIEPWYNFWDQYDPVADPLDPPLSWHAGDQIRPSPEKLFSRIDLISEEPSWIAVEDREVNNVEKSHGGELQAHNYWDNKEDFVKPLAAIISALAPQPLLQAT